MSVRPLSRPALRPVSRRRDGGSAESADLLADLVSGLLLAASAVLVEVAGRAARTSFAGSAWLFLLVLVVLLVVTGLALLRAGRRARANPQRAAVLGASVGLRSGAVFVVLCSWVGGSADLVWAGLGSLILTAAIAVEDLVLRLLRLPVPFVAHLPGVSAPGPECRLVPFIGPTSVAALVLGGVVRLTGLPGWLWAALAVVSLVPLVAVIAHTRARRRAGAAVLRQVPAALAGYAPEFVVYTARPDDASYQVAMWLPYLRRTGRRFVVITRAALPAQALAGLTDIPVIQRRTATELEAALVPSVRAAFYVNASSGNGALTRFGHLRHVYLGHGDSDKPPSYNPTHAMFDAIFAAGPAAVRRYADHGVAMAPEKFRLVGRPQVESVEPARRALAGAPEPVVLYAPTWRGHVSETALSSLAAGEAIVARLLERGVTVIFRPHPFSYDYPDDAATIARIQARLAADAQERGRGHRWGPAAETDATVIEVMNDADALVSDVSSVVSDFLFSAKPYVMVATTADLAAFARDYPIARGAYLVDPQLAGLDEALEQLLGADPRAERRAALRADYLGAASPETGAGDDYARTFVDAVTDVLDATAGPPQPAAETDDGTVRVSRDTIRRHVRALSRTLAGLVVSTATLTLALSSIVAGIRGVLLVFGVLVTGVLLLVALRPFATVGQGESADRPTDRLTVLDAARIAVVFALVAVALAPGGRGTTASLPVGSFTLGLVVAVLAVVPIVAEDGVVRLLGADGVVAANLPALRLRGVSVRLQSAAPMLGTIALMTGGVLIVLLPAAPSLAIVALLAVPGAVAGFRLTRAAVGRARSAVTAEAALPAVLVERDTRFCVYFGSGIGAGYQLGMWLPYFARIGSAYLIICRDRSAFAEIRRLVGPDGPPVLLRETLASVEKIVVPGLRAAFYVNNAVRNTHLIERRELTHVWLNHGDSEKPACFNPVHAIYDVIFAAGQAGIDRYARHGVDIPGSKFRVAGRPQVEAIQPAGPPGALHHGDPTVLYAPTWRGPYTDSQLSSLPQSRVIVEALLRRGVRVIFRAHPFNYRFPDATATIGELHALLAQDRARTGRAHLFGAEAETKRSVVDCFNESDAMISDVSAVVSDYLQSAKPFAIVAVGRSSEQLALDVPASAGGYVLAAGHTGQLDPAVVDETLDRLLGPDPQRSRRLELRRYYLGDFPADGYAEGFLAAARLVCQP